MNKDKTGENDTRCETGRAVGRLSMLDEVKLGREALDMLTHAHDHLGGPAVWRYRKLSEAYELFALAEVSPRFDIEMLDLVATIRCVAHLQVPVPLRPDSSGCLRTADKVRLAIRYPEEALYTPMPGHAFVAVLEPAEVWLSNVSIGAQAMCLGSNLPAGVRLRELVLMAYESLSLQSIVVDETDPAGIMNPDAARWWQQNIGLVPLTRAPFLAPVGSQAI